jgi:hypothetical protein
MKEKFIGVIFALILLINGVVPAVSHASSYSQWCTDVDAYIGTVGQTIFIPKQVVYDLLNDGYSLRDVVTAGFLAQNSEESKPGKVSQSVKNAQMNHSIADVRKILEMKTSANKWEDVAKTLNITPEKFKQDIGKTKQLLSREPRSL